MKLYGQFTLFCLAASLGTLHLSAQDQPSSQREALKQYVADLQSRPDDQSLREKIIKVALETKPVPIIPAEAIEHEGGAEYLFKNAKGESDYVRAAEEYQKALLLAPWAAADYYNLGVAWEKANEPKKALSAFQLYLLAAPVANDANEVRKRIGGLRVAIQQAESARAEEASRQRDESQRRLRADQEKEQACAFAKNLDGARYFRHHDNRYWDVDEIYEIQGCKVFWKEYTKRGPTGLSGTHREGGPYPLVGREFTEPSGWRHTISEDGKRIIAESSTEAVVYVYERVK